MLKQFYFETCFDGAKWQEHVRVIVDAEGLITKVENAKAPGTSDITLSGVAIPGMPNLHSHAFQRLMVGLAEQRRNPNDSFWSWRKIMYQIALTVSPSALKAIATQLYIEMLQHGYTHVCEFHYVHHDVDGSHYQDITTMSGALVAAAKTAGIGLTLLPVQYQFSGFGPQEATDEQRRFISSPDDYLELFSALSDSFGVSSTYRTGVAFHSLRAVDQAGIQNTLDAVGSADCPIHIHISEQTQEVTDCVANYGARPVDWLLDNFPVNDRWCLVHATHLSEMEIQRLLSSGAVAGLCPTTEANLGDGIFPLEQWQSHNGTWGIGSDSQIGLNPFSELRLLEYTARLQKRLRNVYAVDTGDSCGSVLWQSALRGGALASGMPLGRIEKGYRADWVVLDEQGVNLCGREQADLLDTAMFFEPSQCVRDVYVSGKQVVQNGQHAAAEDAAARFCSVSRELLRKV